MRDGRRRTNNGRRIFHGNVIQQSLLVIAVLLPTFPFAASWSAGPEITPATRRSMLQRIALGGASSAASVWLNALSPAFAKNLPDPVSVDTSRTGTRETLEPILQLEAKLKGLSDAVAGKQSAADIDTLAKAIPKEEKAFRSTFDAYSDPVSYKQRFVDQNAFLVYYTQGFDGPGRPSIESDLPVRQTLQYGARNDAWVAWDAFCVELDYQRQNPEEADAEELQKHLQRAVSAIGSYLKASGVR